MEKDAHETKRKQAIPSRELKGHNRCMLRREREIYVKEGRGIENVYEKAVPHVFWAYASKSTIPATFSVGRQGSGQQEKDNALSG